MISTGISFVPITIYIHQPSFLQCNQWHKHICCWHKTRKTNQFKQWQWYYRRKYMTSMSEPTNGWFSSTLINSMSWMWEKIFPWEMTHLATVLDCSSFERVCGVCVWALNFDLEICISARNCAGCLALLFLESLATGVQKSSLNCICDWLGFTKIILFSFGALIAKRV